MGRTVHQECVRLQEVCGGKWPEKGEVHSHLLRIADERDQAISLLREVYDTSPLNYGDHQLSCELVEKISQWLAGRED